MIALFRTVSCALVTAMCLVGTCLGAEFDSELSSRLRNRLEAAFLTDSLKVVDEAIHARLTLRRAYVNRNFQPIWVNRLGITARAERFLRWAEAEPARHGLDPADYHLDAIRMLRHAGSPGALVDLELALSDAFLMLGSHLLAGRLDPNSLDPEWHAMRRQRDLAEVLESAAGLEDPIAALEGLLPRDQAYWALTRELARLRKMAESGSWSAVPEGPTLHPGDSDRRVPLLADRLGLRRSGNGEEANYFGSDLEAAVVEFQRLHGLNPDGAVGKRTLAALNVPVSARVDQIVVNLERWRWLPESLGERFVLVNIANFGLDVVERQSSVLSMRVIVGKTYRRTPVFSGMMAYLVLNPAWEVPHRIAVVDKLPLIKEDSAYLAENRFLVLQGWGVDETRIDPDSVDWDQFDRRNFPFRLRQLPGPQNALGRVKFMFPNEFSVYLHDTPARELFTQEDRLFSSGCIRLEKPIELAELLLSGEPDWSSDKLAAALSGDREQTVSLSKPVPVHLLYWTAWVDTDGKLNFRKDVYERDTRVLKSLALDLPPLSETDT